MNPTPEQVAQWAREAGAYQYGGSAPDRIFTFYSFSQIIQFVTRAMAEQAEVDAKWVEKRLADYDEAHGKTDPDTGTREWPGDGEEYIFELQEIADAIRANAPKVTT